jgi:hypothetical protein
VLISLWLFLFAAQPKEFFLDGLKKLEQRSHKCVELRKEYVEQILFLIPQLVVFFIKPKTYQLPLVYLNYDAALLACCCSVCYIEELLIFQRCTTLPWRTSETTVSGTSVTSTKLILYFSKYKRGIAHCTQTHKLHLSPKNFIALISSPG